MGSNSGLTDKHLLLQTLLLLIFFPLRLGTVCLSIHKCFDIELDAGHHTVLSRLAAPIIIILLLSIPVTPWPAAQREEEPERSQTEEGAPARDRQPAPLSPRDLHAAVRMRAARLSGLLAPLALLLLLPGPSDRLADACSCSPVHPQQAFCNADIVIRAKAIVGKEVESGNDIYGNPIKKIEYEIKQIKMFKGPAEDIQYIYTASSSAVCGVTLETGGKKEYLIAGKGESKGKMHITLCDFVHPWEALTTTQKKSLNQRYEMGCECKISRCPNIPCLVTSHDECLWTDWMTEKSIHGRQAKHYACIKRSDGSCSWYRGTAPPKQEFLDIEDP